VASAPRASPRIGSNSTTDWHLSCPNLPTASLPISPPRLKLNTISCGTPQQCRGEIGLSSNHQHHYHSPKKDATARCDKGKGTIRLLGQVGRGEDVGGAEAGADPGKQRARLLVLERPLQRVRVQRVLPVEPQLRQRRAQRGPAHPRRPRGRGSCCGGGGRLQWWTGLVWWVGGRARPAAVALLALREFETTRAKQNGIC